MLNRQLAYDLQGLLVGVNYYHDPLINRLHFAVNDAQELHRTLFDSAYKFKTRRIDILLSDDQNKNEALRRSILKKLSQVAQNTSENDLLLFYFSGHGDLVSGEPYLCPSDTESDFVSDTAIPLARVREIIEASRASVKLLILDACHLGARLGSKSFDKSKEFNEKTKNIFRGVRGLAMLASSAREETSLENTEKEHGIFTYFLLEGLRNHLIVDKNEDAQISVTEIFNFVALNLRAHGQQPTIILEGSGDLPMFYVSSSPSLLNPIRGVFPLPIKDPENFFGRIDELRRVRDQLLNTSDILIFVHGERCVGKTSFLNRVKAMLDKESNEDTHFLHFSIEPSSMSSVADFAQELWSGFQGVCQAVAPTAFEGRAFSFQGYGQFGFELTDILRQLTTYRFVVFVDEIQKIKNFTDDVTFNQIIGLLRYIIEQTNIRVAFVVSSFEIQQQFFPSSFGSPPSNEDIEIAPFDRADCDAMLTYLFTFDLENLRILFESIYRLSGGHPYVAKMLAAEIYDVVQGASLDSLLSEVAWQELVSKTTKTSDAFNLFSSLYAHFNDDERYVLLSLSLRKDYSISGQEIALWRRSHRSAVSLLEEKHYLLRMPDGGAHLRVQLLGEWLKTWQGFSLEAERFNLVSPSILRTISKEGVCIDEASGKVYLNGKEIESKLSDLQYQALLYLARNVDRVVSRQDLYEFLHDEDEKLLPSDQSLDALVYRLRLALRDQEQQYLQTLRKRGYLLKQATIISN